MLVKVPLQQRDLSSRTYSMTGKTFTSIYL